MRVVTLYAFVVTVYANNNKTCKNAMIKNTGTHAEQIVLFSLFFPFSLFLLSFNQYN